MRIAQRLVKLEKTVENQNLLIEKLQEELKATKAAKPAARTTKTTTKTEATK